jgi:TolB-like protein/DNA-binding winged helix-turn-helix (wHTH) protein/tetratricopeptide (TPR) repeat protein
MPTQVPFGDFVLDLDSRELRRGAEPMKLTPKALQLLEILATGRPKAFSKAELQDRLWPGTFVVEKNLANLVTEIREALGDNPSDQRFIRTVPRYGYSFREQTPAAAPVVAGPARKARASAFAVGAGLLCVVAAAAGVWWVAGRAASTATTIRLAVLPLENLTGDPEQDYLCDGMTEELIAQLGAADPDALKVIARTSAMHYRNTTKRADEIGRELAVQYLLETGLRRVGDSVRVTAQLVSTETQDHVWSEQYEHHFTDALALQRQVAVDVVRRATASLGVAMETAGTQRPPGNSAVYEHYLRGRHHLQKGTRDGLEKARGHFQRAIALDSAYARGYSGLADTYLALGEFALIPIAESHPLAREAAVTALRLDDSLADAHRSFAAISGQHYWQWAEAENAFQRAIQLAPNDVSTLRMYAFYLAYTGRPAQGLPIAERAVSLDPVSIDARLNLGVVLYMAGRADEAVRQLEDTLDLNDRFGFAHAMLGLTYASKGMPDRAVAEAAKARSLAQRRPDIVAVHGFTLGRAGHRREALATLDDIRRLTNSQTPPPFQMAVVHVGLEDWDRAFEWLEKAVDGRAWEVPLVKADPVFNRLRLDPRFPKLLARLRLPE